MIEPGRITGVTQITDHVESGLALFIRKFKNADNLRGLASAWLTQVQEIEDALWSVVVLTLDNATDDQLDQIGGLLKFARGTLDDASYRAILRAVVAARRSAGTSEDLIGVAALALNGVLFDFREGTASVWIEPHAPIGFDARALLEVLRLAKEGGVEVQVSDPPRAESALFTFSSDPLRIVTSSTLGLSNEAQDTGGHLTGVVAALPGVRP